MQELINHVGLETEENGIYTEKVLPEQLAVEI